MDLDVDEIVDRALGWDLTLKLGGKKHATRPLVLADELAFAAACQDENMAALKQTVASVLQCQPDELPNSSKRLLAAFVAVRSYAEANALKNLKAIAAEIGAAVANPTTGARGGGQPSPASGASTPPPVVDSPP